MTLSNSTNISPNNQAQTIAYGNLISSLNAFQTLPKINLNGNRVYELVKCFIGSSNNDSLTDYFIQNRDRLNSINSNGDNALHVAIDKKDFNNLIKLIALGINYSHQNNAGLDSLEYAKQKGFTEGANFIEKLKYGETFQSQKKLPSQSPNPDKDQDIKKSSRVSLS